MSKEYNNKANSGNVCSYANLNGYNDGQPKARVPEGTPSQSVQVLPMYEPIRPGALQHHLDDESKPCGHYFNIETAYPSASGGSCQTKYVNRPCSGLLQ